MKSYKGLVTKYIKNERRSVVPIFLSIVLTISLITSVVFITQNIVKNNFEEKKILFGDYDIRFQDLDKNRLSKFKASDNVKNYILGKNDEELINKSQGLTNEDSWLTYVDAYGVEKKFIDEYITLNVVEGRLPEKQNEIVMNKSVLSRFSGKYEVGSTIRFSQRERKITAEYMYRAGQIYNELDNSKVKDIESIDREIQELVDKDIKVENDKTVNYTIVGIIETPVGDTLFGDKIIRLLSDEEIANTTNTFEAFTYLKDTSKEEQFTKELGLRYIVPNISMIDPFGYPGAEVKYPGYDKDSYSSIRVNALARMIILIIIIFCFMAVYNTFHSSIAKRIKVYGILRALGGTMNQISYLIYYEALALYIIAAPIGLIIGYGLTKLESYILINWLGLLESFTMDFNLEVILITLVSVLLIILIAFRSVLKKEGKLTPIEAIMDARGLTRKKKSLGKNIFGKANTAVNNEDDDDKKIKELLDYDKTTFKFRIMQKLFKFEGELAHKNITRDSKTHSLTKSTLFFAMAILICFYLQVVVGGINARNIIKSDKWDTELTLNSGDFDNEVIEKINNVNGVEKIYTTTQEKAFLVQPNKFLSSELQAVLIEKPYKKIDKEHDTQGLTANIITVDDNSIKLYNGVKKEDLDSGGVLMVNKSTGYMTRVSPLLVYYIYMDSDPVLKYKIGDKLSLSEDDTVLEMEGLAKYYKEERPFKDLNIVGIVDDDKIESTYKSRDRFELDSDVKLITTEKGLNIIFEKSGSIVTKDSISKRILVKTTNNEERANTLSEIKVICANNNYEFKDTIGNKLMLERNIRQDLGLNIIFAVTVLIMVILNLINTSNASILSRRKELAAMRAIGMSNSQERRMIVGELFYISLSVAFTIIITVVVLSIESQSMNIAAGKVSVFTFLSGEFIIIIALMIISNLTALAPLAQAKKFSIVEDLKEE